MPGPDKDFFDEIRSGFSHGRVTESNRPFQPRTVPPLRGGGGRSKLDGSWMRGMDGLLRSQAWPGRQFETPAEVYEFIERERDRAAGLPAFGRWITGKYDEYYRPQVYR